MELNVLKNILYKLSCHELTFLGIYSTVPHHSLLLNDNVGYIVLLCNVPTNSNIVHLCMLISTGQNKLIFIDPYGKVPKSDTLILIQKEYPSFTLYYSKAKLQKPKTCLCALIITSIVLEICQLLSTGRKRNNKLFKATGKSLQKLNKLSYSDIESRTFENLDNLVSKIEKRGIITTVKRCRQQLKKKNFH